MNQAMRTTSRFSVIKRIFIFLVIASSMICSVNELSAQNDDWLQMVTVPQAPDDRFGVCDTAETDTFIFTNNSGASLSNLTMTLALPVGMYYEMGSLTDLSGSGISETNPATPLFTIPGSFSHGAVVSFTLNIYADCNAIELSTGIADNNFAVTLNYSGADGTFTQLSPNFEVAKPTLNMPPVTPNPLPVTLGLIDTIDVVVNNGGQASVDSFFYFVLKHDQLSLLSLHNAGQALPLHSTRPGVGAEKDTLVFLIAGAMLKNAIPFAGNSADDTLLLQFKEYISFKEVWRVDGCDINALDLRRGVEYGCGGMFCEQSVNASGVAYGLLRPNLVWQLDKSFAENNPLCYDDSIVQHFRMYNGGTAYAKDIAFDVYNLAGNSNVQNLDTNNMSFYIKDSNGIVVQASTLLNDYKISQVVQTNVCPGEVPGIYRAEYRFGSGIRMNIGDTMFIRIGYRRPCSCFPDQMYTTGFTRLGAFVRQYQDPCDLGPYNIKTYPHQGEAGSRINHGYLRAWYRAIPEGPNYLANGQRGCIEYDFTAYTNRFYYYGGSNAIDASNAVLEMKYVVDQGLDFVNDASNPFRFIGKTGNIWTPSSIEYTDHNGGPDTAIVRFTGVPPPDFRSPSGGNGLLGIFCVEADCQELLGCGSTRPNVNMEMSFSPDTTCAGCDLMDVHIANNWDVEVDCPCGIACRGFAHTNYSLQRINFGCGDNNNNAFNEPGEYLDESIINKRRFIPGDTLEAVTSGIYFTDDTVTAWPYSYVRTTLPANIDSFRALDAEMIIWDAPSMTSYSCNALQQFNNGKDIFTNISPDNMRLLGCNLPLSLNSYTNGDSVEVRVRFTINDQNINLGPEEVRVTDSTFTSLKAWPVEVDSQYRCTGRQESATFIGIRRNRFSASNYNTGGCNPTPFYFYDYTGYGNNWWNDFFRYEIRSEQQAVEWIKFKLSGDLDFYYMRAIFSAWLPSQTGVPAVDRVARIDINHTSQYVTISGDDSITVNMKGLRDSLGWPLLDKCFPDQGMQTLLYVYPRPTCETIIDDELAPAGTSPHDSMANFRSNIIADPKSNYVSEFGYSGYARRNYNYLGGANLQLQTATNELFISSREGCFQFDIINPTDYDAGYTYFTATPLGGNIGILNVYDITDGIPVLIQPTQFGVYQLGSFAKQENGIPNTRTYQVCVVSNACMTDSVQVDIGYDCGSYPFSAEEAKCSNPQIVRITPYESEIQQIVREPSSNLTLDLCDTVDFMVQISASKLGSLSDIIHSFTLPTGMVYVPQSFYLAWPVPVDGSDTMWRDAPDEPILNWGTTYSINVSDQQDTLMREGLIGAFTGAPNFLLVKFRAYMECGFASGSAVRFTSFAYDACGELTNYANSPSPPISNTNVSSNFASAINFDLDSLNACKGETTPLDILINIQNTLGSTSSGDSISVILPPGIIYSSGSYVAGTNAIPSGPSGPVTTTGLINGGQEVSIMLPAGISNGSIAFSIELEAVNVGQRCEDEEILISSFSTTRAYCYDNNGIKTDSCDVRALSDQRSGALKIIKPDLLILGVSATSSPSPPDSILVEVCVDLVNLGEPISSSATTVIEFYEDINNNTTYDPNVDVLIGSITTTTPIGRNQQKEICGSFKTAAGVPCRLLAVVNPSVTCACDVEQSTQVIVDLVQDLLEASACHLEATNIGPTPVNGIAYTWLSHNGSNLGFLSSTTGTPVSFTGFNTSGQIQYLQYVLRSVNGACPSYDTLDITLYPYVYDSISVVKCEDDIFNLLGPPGGSNYSWLPTTNLSNPSIRNPQVNGVPNNITYVLTYQDENGCPARYAAFIQKGNCANATSLGDTVWCDDNVNGVQDLLESGVPGIGVNLYTCANLSSPIASTVTNANGAYIFNNLAAGYYRVEFVDPSDKHPTSKDVGSDDTIDSDMDSLSFFSDCIYLANGDSNITVDAGFYTATSLGDTVWSDDNWNGIQDPNEPGIANVVVRLFSSNGTYLRQTTTNANGYYLFSDLALGTYFVIFDLNTAPANFFATHQDAGLDDNKDSDADPNFGITPTVSLLTPGASNYSLDLGLFKPASISDFVWLDRDKNGIQDFGEIGLEGVEVSLYSANGSLIETTTSDLNGYYIFDSLLAGTYAVQFTAPLGYLPTLPLQGTNGNVDSDPDLTGWVNSIVLSTGQDNDRVDAGFYETVYIGDFVWLDQNTNGLQDPGEPGIPNVVVELYDGNANLLETTLTDGNGKYSFSDLLAGVYQVGFVNPPNHLITLQNIGNSDQIDSDPDLLTSLGPIKTYTGVSVDTSIDAGYTGLVAIGDRVWNDVNRDGIQNNGEIGIQGVEIVLWDAINGAPLATTVTSATGNYLFENNYLGSYYLAFNHSSAPPNFAPTLDNIGLDNLDSDADRITGLSHVLNMFTPAERDSSVDGGYFLPAMIGDTVWSDLNLNGIQDGEPGLPGIQVQLLDEFGFYLTSTITNGSGYYLFDDLAPGTYSVKFILPVSHAFSPKDVGSDLLDSDADVSTGITSQYTLVSGTVITSVDAGIYALVALGDFVWDDLNADGIQQNGEPGISGVRIQLQEKILGQWTTMGIQYSGTQGEYLFDDLEPGKYRVQFSFPSGNWNLSPQDQGTNDRLDSDIALANLRSPVVNLMPGDRDSTIDAGFYRLAKIGNYVWEDSNLSGRQEGTEPAMPGVLVELLDPLNGNPIQSMLTNALGEYCFDDLEPGDYKIRITAPSSYYITYQNIGANDAIDSDVDVTTGESGVVNLISGEEDLTVDAGLLRTSSISDYVWNDMDVDGIQDSSEVGVAGVRVWLHDAISGLIIQTAYTNAQGYYTFTDLPPYIYYLQFDSTTFPMSQNNLMHWKVTLMDVATTSDTTDSDVFPIGPYQCFTNWIQLNYDDHQTKWDLGIFDPVQGSPLPVDLVDFSATTDNSFVYCDWETRTEVNNDRFEIERSINPISSPIEAIGQVKGAGTTNIAQEYQLIDRDPYFGKSFYRLVQFDFDGTRTELDWHEVTLNANTNEFRLNVYPNPTTDQANLLIHSVAENAYIDVYDGTGRLILHRKVMLESGKYLQVLETASWAAGLYNVKVFSGSDSKTIQLSVK